MIFGGLLLQTRRKEKCTMDTTVNGYGIEYLEQLANDGVQTLLDRLPKGKDRDLVADIHFVLHCLCKQARGDELTETESSLLDEDVKAITREIPVSV